MRDMTEKQMRDRFGNDDELCAKLIPNWKVGYCRLAPGEGYLEALLASNVSLDNSPLEEVAESGIISGNSTEEFNIIVCATSFHMDHTPSFNMSRRNGVKLRDRWRSYPEA